MCCEDIRIGKDSGGVEFNVTVGATSVPFLGASDKRVGIILANVSAGSVTISTNSPAVSLQGLTIRSTDRPICLRIEEYGDLVNKSWVAIADMAGRVVTVIEVLSDYCE